MNAESVVSRRFHPIAGVAFPASSSLPSVISVTLHCSCRRFVPLPELETNLPARKGRTARLRQKPQSHRAGEAAFSHPLPSTRWLIEHSDHAVEPEDRILRSWSGATGIPSEVHPRLEFPLIKSWLTLFMTRSTLITTLWTAEVSHLAPLPCKRLLACPARNLLRFAWHVRLGPAFGIGAA